MSNKSFFLVSILLVWGSASSLSLAQVTTNITPSGGLGTTLNGGVPACTSNCTITGGTRPGNGPNLFHSFGNFNVGAGDTANFLNDSGLATTNILSRVTGGNPSNIFGTIQTTGFGNANLFLINPAGVVFGPTASLDIGSSVGTPGSFHVSTADYVRLFDGTNSANFYANPASDGMANSVLSSAPPVDFGFLAPQAFGFLDPNPAAIAIQGSTLQVGEGQTLSVVGGNRTFMTDEGVEVPSGVTLEAGALGASGGRINLASVASPGEILLSNMQTAPNVNGDSFTAMGAISLSAGATLDVSGDPGGTVLIRGGQLVMDGAFIFADTQSVTEGSTTAVDINVSDGMTLINGGVVLAQAFDTGRGGDIAVSASTLTMSDGAGLFTIAFGGDPDTQTAGNILLNVGTVHLSNVAQVQSLTFGAGRSGDITINGTGVVLEGGSFLETDTFSTGSGGNITVNLGSGSLDLNNGQIVTNATEQGPAGHITINAGSVSLLGPDFTAPSFIQTATTGPGSAGDITMNVETVLLQGVASINNQSFSDTPAGSILIEASGSVTLSGPSANIASNNLGVATGTSGTVEIITPVLALNGGSVTTVNTSPARGGDIILRVGNGSLTGGGSVHTDTGGPGRGGDVVVTGDSVSISGTGSGLFSDSSSSAAGRAGDIQVQGRQIDLSGGATISAQSTGTGNAGNIAVTATDSLVMQGSSISTATTQSDGGDIHIQAVRLVQLTNSQITTSVQGGLGNGGNITIDPQFVILQNSQIIANAFGGNGGNILIVAGLFLMDSTSTVSASSTFGLSGTVNIQATVTNLSESLSPLSGEFAQAAELLRARCAARFSQSSLVLAGRDGVPSEPGGQMPSPLFVEGPRPAHPAMSMDVPSLQVGRVWGESAVLPAALDTGCAS